MPLRMIIHGEGSTGKSKVLQSVTEAFCEHGAHHMLLKAAYTRVAASLIDGKTTHVIAGVSLTSSGETTMSDEAKAKLEIFWRPIKYLFIDEMSMLAKDFFALLSRNASIGKRDLSNSSFGGINVIILGDFHQFPPVARSIRDALYYPSKVETDSLQSQIGCSIYEEFKMVVTLKEQKRVSDPIWLRFLRHLRTGQVCDEDLKMLRSLVIGNTKNKTTDFSTHPWKHAALVTPRHAVRKRWNDDSLMNRFANSVVRMAEEFMCAQPTTRPRATSQHKRKMSFREPPVQKSKSQSSLKRPFLSSGNCYRYERYGHRECGNRPRHNQRCLWRNCGNSSS